MGGMHYSATLDWMPLEMPLVDSDDSVLVVVDAQEGFFGDRLPQAESTRARQALARITWLAKVARQLVVPAVLTEEDPQLNGPTYAPIAETFDDAPALVKPTFGLTGTPEIVERIEGTGRGTARLCASTRTRGPCSG